MNTQDIRFRMTRTLHLALLVLMAVGLNACVTYEYHETKFVELSRLDQEQVDAVDDQELLDVGIVLFTPGDTDVDDDTAAYSSVRQSEAVWFSSQLKAALDYSNAWASVRTLPRDRVFADVTVRGEIVDSNGEEVRLKVSAVDSSGRNWFEKDYYQRASSYSYNPEVNSNLDPFHAVFAEMANDLFDFRSNLTSGELMNIRDISKIKFARSVVPDAFEGFLQEEDGQFSLLRAPAVDDPMVKRINALSSRNDLFLDVIQDYYRGFNGLMAQPYQEWRKATYKSVIYDRQLRKKAKQEKIAGLLAVVGGVLIQNESGSRYARAGGYFGSIYGAHLFRYGYQTQAEAETNTQALRELSNSLELALAPSVIDLQERSVTLTGTVEDQFKEWSTILRDIYYAENGLEAPFEGAQETDADAIEYADEKP